MAGVDVALGIAGVGVALPALAETAVRYGRFVVSKYSTLKDGQAEHDTQRLLVKLHWDEIQATILFFARSCDRFDSTVRDLVEAHLQILLKKFEVVILNLQKNVRPDNEIRRLRYALFGKNILEDLIADLEKWQTRFLQYLQLITFTGHRLIEPDSPAADLAEKAPSLKAFTKLQDLSAMGQGHHVAPNPPKESDYPDSQAKLLRCCNVLMFPRPATSSSASTIDLVDRRYYDKDHDNVDYIRQIVRQTARILSAADPEAMGILPCRGFIHRPHLSRFDLVLSLPSTTTTYPRSLRDLLTDPIHGGHASHSLSERLFFAKKLASAVFYMHTSKLVHKNIRPETILVLPATPTTLSTTPGDPSASQMKRQGKTAFFPYALGRPVLVGFDNVRQVELDWASKRNGTLSWEEDVYQHPSRHGATAAKYYSVQHDVYSLGVVLIEIAMWQSFIVFDKEMQDSRPNVALWGKAGSKVEGVKTGGSGAGEGVMAHLEKLARLEVPVVMGDKYRKVILSCLGGIGEQGEETDDVELGVRFIETVLDLEDISI
ncbi:MAG: hypothetical protein LQ349_004034 [Xanthoria aureola]|nr:MAG: hypothetical protein LQ349_004034 [Xanthoria aureola]